MATKSKSPYLSSLFQQSVKNCESLEFNVICFVVKRAMVNATDQLQTPHKHCSHPSRIPMQSLSPQAIRHAVSDMLTALSEQKYCSAVVALIGGGKTKPGANLFITGTCLYIVYRVSKRYLQGDGLPTHPRKGLEKIKEVRHGGDIVAAVLKRQEIDTVFTLSGGHISPILVSARQSGIRVVDVRHEVNAAFAADGYSRMTGKVGVAIVTAGPGITNTITAIKNAEMAHSPMILIGGATPTLLKGKGSLQDIDQPELMEPLVKWIGKPRSYPALLRDMERAFIIAKDGVPGPVFIELPVDLLYPQDVTRKEIQSFFRGSDLISRSVMQALTWRYDYMFRGGANLYTAEPAPIILQKAPAAKVKKAAKLLSTASKPVIVIGSQAMSEDVEFCDLLAASLTSLGLPVYCAGMARGLLGTDSSLQLLQERKAALKAADVVLLLGFPMDFRLGYGTSIGSKVKIISCNLSEDHLWLNRKPHLAIHAHPLEFVRDLSSHAHAIASGKPEARAAWWQELRANEAKKEAKITVDSAVASPSPGLLKPLWVCRQIEAHLPPRAILVADGGDFVGTAAYTIRPRRPLGWLDPGAFGTLGVGAGFCLAAALASKDPVYAIYGDGSFGYSLAELDTFTRHGIAVIIIIGNDACWGQIARAQVEIFDDDVACALTYANYEKASEALGAVGFRVTTEAEMKQALVTAEKLQKAGKSVVINCLLAQSNFRQGSISI